MFAKDSYDHEGEVLEMLTTLAVLDRYWSIKLNPLHKKKVILKF